MAKSNFKEPKLVLVFNGAKVLIGITRSMHSAAQMTGISLQAIAFCCSGKYIATSGLYFRNVHPDIEIEVSDLDRLRLDEYDEMCNVKRKYYTVRMMAHKRAEVMKNKKMRKNPKNNNEDGQ